MKFNPEKELADLSGKVVIVTGSTYVGPYIIMQVFNSCFSSGIGFATAQYLFDKGARVYLAVRNEEKANRCIEKCFCSLGQTAVW